MNNNNIEIKMNSLFTTEKNKNTNRTINSKTEPLAERVRPKNIEEISGQSHLFSQGKPLRMFLEKGSFPSIILWGPPGCGKTTIAYIIAKHGGYKFFRISAVEAGVKDIRRIIEEAKNRTSFGEKNILFIDEIHRFNKSQQDALLHAVETGILTLIGATTENPSFEVNSALLSRCQTYKLNLLSKIDIQELVERALRDDFLLNKYKIEIEDFEFLYRICSGDARSALNAIELTFMMSKQEKNDKIIITNDLLVNALQQKQVRYDKKGEDHFDTISAFIKSLRGSDPDAAMLWLAKMLEAGEDAKFIARRLVIFASEDVGNADTYAITLAVAVFQAVNLIGMPECRINLAQCVTYLASCPKSNASYIAINQAMSDVKNSSDLSVPLHLRNAPTKLMKKEGYGKNYQYPHDYPNHFVKENYFPENFDNKIYYEPCITGKEKFFKERLEFLWERKY